MKLVPVGFTQSESSLMIKWLVVAELLRVPDLSSGVFDQRSVGLSSGS